MEKHLIVLAALTILFIYKASTLKINTKLLSSTAHDLVEKSLKRGEMQTYLDSLSYEVENTGRDSLYSIINSVGEKFKEGVEAIQKLQSGTVDLLSTSFSPSPGVDCSSVSNITYDPRFRTKVNTETGCNQAAPAGENSSQILSVDSFTRIGKDNLIKLPSIKWQYFASEEGNTLFYPAANSPQLQKLDCRFRPWYVQANVPTPKHVIIVFDKSGSMSSPHDGVPLLTIAKRAVKSLITTLNPNDKFAVVAFSSMPEMFVDAKGDESCFSYNLAQASPQNKREVSKFVDAMKAKGGTSYGRALSRAFHLLHSQYNATTDRDTQRVILFISDGAPEESKLAVLKKLHKSSESINHSAIIMTYGVGGEDFNLLRDIATFHPNVNKKGLFFPISKQAQLRNEMVSYYKQFAAEGRNVTEPIWTTPYLDSFGLGQIITGSLPVIVDNELKGVVAADFLLGDLVLDSSNFHFQRFSYSFVISGTGILMNHPLFPYRTDHDTTYLYATSFEQDAEFTSIYDSMKRGEDGEKSFVSTTFVGSDGSPSDGLAQQPVNSTYIWKKIPGANFSICIVFVLDQAHLHFLLKDSVPPKSLAYHRFDLVLPSSPCIHLNNIAAKDQASLFLAPKTFHTYDDFFSKELTLSDVQALIKYFEGSGPNELKLKEHVKAEVVVTQFVQSLWTAADETLVDPQKHIWRYIGIESGVFRLFPGGQIPDQYDPTKRSWYIMAIENAEKMVISAPYLDAVLEAPVITFARTVFKQSLGQDGEVVKEILGVMGVDISLRHFNQLMKELYADLVHNYTIYVVNYDGDVVMNDYYVGDGGNLRFTAAMHLTAFEPKISDILISNEMLVRVNCCLPENGLVRRKYKFSKETQSLSGRLYNENSCSYFEFSISHVPNTNTFILLRSKVEKPCEQDRAINATEDKNYTKSCSTNWNWRKECKCVCSEIDPDFNLCGSSYDTSSNNQTTLPPVCLPEPSVLSFVINSIDLSQLPTCYIGFGENAEKVSTLWTIVGFLVVGTVIGIIVLLLHYIQEFKKAKIKKNLAKRRATLKFQKDLIVMFEKAMIAQPNIGHQHHHGKNTRSRKHSTKSEQNFTKSPIPENSSSVFLYVPQKTSSFSTRKRRSLNKVSSIKIVEENEPPENEPPENEPPENENFERNDRKLFSKEEIGNTSMQIGEDKNTEKIQVSMVNAKSVWEKMFPEQIKADVPEKTFLQDAIKWKAEFERESKDVVLPYSKKTDTSQSSLKHEAIEDYLYESEPNLIEHPYSSETHVSQSLIEEASHSTIPAPHH